MSGSKSNSFLTNHKNFPYVSARRDIDIGEEITISYGFSYWCQKVSKEKLNSIINQLSTKKRNFLKTRLYHFLLERRFRLLPNSIIGFNHGTLLPDDLTLFFCLCC